MFNGNFFLFLDYVFRQNNNDSPLDGQSISASLLLCLFTLCDSFTIYNLNTNYLQ